MTSAMTYDVIIIGAGIVGCACAREFSRAGLRVAIVERDRTGGATTAAGMGHIVLLDDSPAQLALTSQSRTLWRELAEELPEAVEYEPRGTIWVAADGEEMAEAEAKKAKFAEFGIRSVLLSTEVLAELEPNLRPGLAGALLVPDDVVVDPPAAARYFLDEARKHNAVLLQPQTVVRADEGAVQFADGTKILSTTIVLATGADTDLLPSLPIQKRKGHLALTDHCPGLISHQLVELGYLKSAHKTAADSVAFNVQPRRDGTIFIGASRQYGNEDHGVDQMILDAMLERAYSYMPALRQVKTLRTRTGFRAATPDKLPIVGPTGDASLFLAMGFEGFGNTCAPGAATLLADYILHRPFAIPPQPYLPSRFVRKDFE